MINILKLRKLEKQNKQKVQDEQSAVQEAFKELPLEENPVSDALPAKDEKVKGRKKKIKETIKKSEETSAEDKSLQEKSSEEIKPENADQNITPISEENNPVEIFRQNLLNELLNSDSLPEYTDSRYSEQTGATGQDATEQIIYNQQEVVNEVLNTLETTQIKATHPANPEPTQADKRDYEMHEPVKKSLDAVVHLVSFSLGRECYGVDIMRIREIIRTVDVTKVPRAPEFIEGVMNLRGSVIPVVNLRTRIKLPRKEYDKSTRIIVMELRDKVIGFIVDEVKEVLRIPESVISPPPVLTIGKNVEYITSVAKLENSLIILIDAEKLLSDSELDKMRSN